jgi:NAD+ synthase (glutamine-hydrolysing)
MTQHTSGRRTASGTAVRIAGATLNQTVGDWRGNLARIEQAIVRARAQGAGVLVLPEMCISGYSLGDRLLRAGTLRRSWDVLEGVARAAGDMVVCAGLPIRSDGVIYNAMAVVSAGEVHGLVCKENLATGDVEYEGRWYQPWEAGRVSEYVAHDGTRVPIGNLVFDLGGSATLALEICEDGWMGVRPGSRYALAGADVIANPSASWFAVGKHHTRRRMVEQISLEDHCAYVYTSLLGCDATRLVFDGSLFVAVEGEMLAEGRRFVFGDDIEMVCRTVDLEAVRQKRMENGSWRQQVARQVAGHYGAMPTRVEVDIDVAVPYEAMNPPPYWASRATDEVDPSLSHLADAGLGPRLTAADVSFLEVELALALGLRDYMRKTGVPGYCLSLSGGRDSTMVALLIRRMFTYDKPELSKEDLDAWVRGRFTCAYMATVNSSQHTRDAARAVATEVGSEFLDGDIDSVVGGVRSISEGMLGRELSWEDPVDDLALQNVQARARSVIIWMVANVRRYVLLATSNLSEAAVGYTTMDGDTSGGLAPIADVPKGMIGPWLRWAQARYQYPSVDKVLGVPASAELRPQEDEQTDEDDLMPFVVLDELMYYFVQKAMDPAEIFTALWPSFQERYGGNERAFADHTARFVRMLCRAQWKRERFAISFRVLPFDLDPKGGFRFPPVQKGFEEEIAEMYELVDAMEAQRA